MHRWDMRFYGAMLAGALAIVPTLSGQAQHIAPIRSTNAPAPPPAQHSAPAAHAGHGGNGPAEGARTDPSAGSIYQRQDLPAQPGLAPQAAPPTGLTPQAAGYPGIVPGALRPGSGVQHRDRRRGAYAPIYAPVFYPGAYSYGYGFGYPYVNAGLDPENTFPSYGEGQPVPFWSDVALQQQQQQMLSDQVAQLSQQLDELRAGVPTQPQPVQAETPQPNQPPITVVLKTGAKFTTPSFAVMNGYLWDLSGARPRKIAVNTINVPASERATSASGAEFPTLTSNQ